MKTTAALIAAMLALSGCLSGGSSKPSSGALALGDPGPAKPKGAKPVTADIIAAMDGGLIGGAIGKDLESGERERALEAEYQALEHTPNGQIVTWRSDRSGRYGEVVASQPYRVGSQDCRQYTHTVFTGAEPNAVRGTACRNADGSWTPLT